jgi:hypothetical protein
MINISTPVISNRFHVSFHKSSEDAIIEKIRGDDDNLSLNLVEFSLDKISKNFLFRIRLPADNIEGTFNDLDKIKSFTHNIFNGNNKISYSKRYEIDTITKIYSNYTYIETNPVILEIEGKYK